MQEKLADGTLSAEAVAGRIERLGVTEFDEITFVMRKRGFCCRRKRPPRSTPNSSPSI